jgi:NO-binding membrane sensor protein with MHYT domain
MNTTSIIALVAAIYGLAIVVVSIIMGNKMAGKNCSAAALRSNQGLLFLGGVIMTSSMAHLVYSDMYKCNVSPSLSFDNTFMFSVLLFVFSVSCVTLSSIVQHHVKNCGDDKVDVSASAPYIWIPGSVLIVLSVYSLVMHFRSVRSAYTALQ